MADETTQTAIEDNAEALALAARKRGSRRVLLRPMDVLALVAEAREARRAASDLGAVLAGAFEDQARFRPVGWAALDQANRVAATGSDGMSLWIGSTREDVLEPAGEVFVRDPGSQGTPGGDT